MSLRIMLGLLICAIAGCRAGSEGLAKNKPQTAAPSEINVSSPAFAEGQPIAERYTSSENISPPLNWSGIPQQAKSIAVMVEDPDAPGAHPFVHWIAYNIPPDAKGLPEITSHSPTLSDPKGAMQGLNSMKRMGYFHPAPPPGDKPHHYHFEVYALDRTIDEPNLGRNEFLKAIDGHVLAKGELVGTYRRGF